MNKIETKGLLNILRVIALACNDSLIESWIVDAIGENKAEIVKELRQTCWSEDTDFSKHLLMVREDLRNVMFIQMDIKEQLALEQPTLVH
jgi:hypothetical protein